LNARLDRHGAILLMEDQDRGQWDRRLIGRAVEFLDRSAAGTVLSTYHLEAAIAFHHCTAASFVETDWLAILKLYDALLACHRSPVYVLNRAIVIAQLKGPLAGIRALDEANADDSLRHYHLFDAALGEFYRRAGDLARACEHFQAARRKTKSAPERELIDRRIEQCMQ
jgi:predicted RNA polymerase sigma factor